MYKQMYVYPNREYECTYFDIYDTNKNEIICLITNNKFQIAKQKQLIINRINQSYKCFQNQIFGLYKFYQKIQISIDNKFKIILIYQGIDINNNLINLPKNIDIQQIVDLSQFLLNIIIKTKQCNSYFGTINPSRIFSLSNSKFAIVGGEFFVKQIKTKQFFNRNINIKNNLTTYWKYQPPQIYNEDGLLNYSSDLFVIACILYQLITGQYPFPTKSSLLSHDMPPKQNYSQITKLICTKILKPKQNYQRIQPQKLLQILQLQRGKSMFSTCQFNLLLPNHLNQNVKSSFFHNFQQFIIKCITETQGWFLYFCQNTQQQPQNKYLQQILYKIAKKNQKINKLIALIQKCSQKSFSAQNTPSSEQDNTYTLLKMGILILNLLRKMPLEIIQPYFYLFTKISSQMISKMPFNIFMAIIYKIIAFKLSLQSKFPYLNGNFYLKIQQFKKITLQSLQYLSQYNHKIVSYLISLIQQNRIQNTKPVQNLAILTICDQLYDSISILLYSLISIKKDQTLKLLNQQQKIQQNNIIKIDNICSDILIKIGKIYQYNTLLNHHNLYSINFDYYEYKQQIYLIYQPITTSYQYFFIDQPNYKGLSLPKNYNKIYNKDQNFQQQLISSKYQKRQLMNNRITNNKSTKTSIKSLTSVTQSKIKQKNNKQFQFNIPSNRSLTKQDHIKKQNHYNSVLPNNQDCHKQGKKPQSKQISASNISKQTFTTGVSKNDQTQIDQSWLQAQLQDIMSYEWLKKTQKTIVKQFQKPELDPIIYVIYEDFRKSLKLQQLIAILQKNKKIIVDPNKILFQKVIGSGNAGEVYIGKYKQKIIAIKKIKIQSNPNALKQFQRQVLTYIKIKIHPNLVSLVGLTKYHQDYFLLTQFCQGGSLFDLLHKKINQIPLSWKQRISIAKNIAKGMEFLHYMNPPVVHRDLKSLNVFMVKKNGQWIAKVADFGLSRSHEAGMMTSALGTLHWMAPQLLNNKQYSLKVDVYSFGVLLWQICTRRTPYHNLPNQMAIVKHVVLQKGRPMMQLINQGCPKQLMDIMIKCWNEQPQIRPYFPQIVQQLNKLLLQLS